MQISIMATKKATVEIKDAALELAAETAFLISCYEKNVGETAQTKHDKNRIKSWKQSVLFGEIEAIATEDIIDIAENISNFYRSEKPLPQDIAEVDREVSKEQVRAIFEEEIWPKISELTVPSDDPVSYILGGQPGAGKLRVAKTAYDETHGNILAVIGDEFRFYHPQFDAIQAAYGLDAPHYTGSFAGGMVKLALQRSREQQRNVLVEGTFRTAEVPLNTATEFRNKRYRIEVFIVTCPASVSRASIGGRYVEMVNNGQSPRFTPSEYHAQTLDSLSANAQIVADSGILSRLRIFNRNSMLYDSEISDMCGVREILEEEIHRDINEGEKIAAQKHHEDFLRLTGGKI